MELYLIRHGETKWNEEKRLQGQVDIPLNANGRKLGQITGAALKAIPFDHIYVSPLSRALETAELVTLGRPIPTTIDDRLTELSFGPWEGQAIASLPPEYRNFASAPDRFTEPEGAESLTALEERTADFVMNVLVPASAKYRRVLIVGHGACGQSIKLCLNHKGLADFWKPSFPHNCSVSIFAINGSDFRLIEDNRIYYDPSLARAGSLIK